MKSKSDAIADKDRELRKYLVKNLDSKEAHVDFDAAIKGLPPSARGIRPESMPYSLWQLMEHLRLAQRDILDFCLEPNYSSPKWPEGYWPRDEAPPSKGAWKQSIAEIKSDRKAFAKLISDPSIDLLAEIPWGDGQTYLREALLAADHSAYHIGEIVALRRMLGVWKTTS